MKHDLMMGPPTAGIKGMDDRSADVPEAIRLLKQIVALHGDHISGAVKSDDDSMQEEMQLVKAALAALGGDMGMGD